MELKPAIFLSKVMHKRLFPKENGFSYNVYYLALPLDDIEKNNIPGLPINKPGILSFYEKDHGYRDGSSLKKWATELLEQHNIKADNLDILLISMPRVMGYAFNPISLYFCFDKDKNIKAVISEVNNTFGETHSYICQNPEGFITPDLWMEAEKTFHVSPFLKREGHYHFRFDYRTEKLGFWVDYFDAEGKKELITSLIGNFISLNRNNLLKTFIKHPLVTFKTIFLIHYQAVRLFIKGIKYITKPMQSEIRVSQNITKS